LHKINHESFDVRVLQSCLFLIELTVNKNAMKTKKKYYFSRSLKNE